MAFSTVAVLRNANPLAGRDRQNARRIDVEGQSRGNRRLAPISITLSFHLPVALSIDFAPSRHRDHFRCAEGRGRFDETG